jgi:hypothetical protein
MMDPDELRGLCAGFREKPKRRTDGALIDRIEFDVQGYRAFLADPRPQLPPERLAGLLPLMGWLIYESSWEAVQRVATAFELLPAAGRSESDIAYGQVRRLANAARELPWPEFAPRALGAIRAQALAESKRDTQGGYDAAWTAHQEARKLHRSYLDSHGGGPARERFSRDLDEVLLQLALAETGTACRTAERVISRWGMEELAVPGAEEGSAEEDAAEVNAANEARWIQRMHRELYEGVQVGELAIATVTRIKKKYGLVETVDENRLALLTGFQNPGIMTARAALLALALCPAMEGLGRSAPDGKSWPGARAGLLKRFETAYRSIEEPVTKTDGAPVPMRPEHLRSLVQIRLNLALLMPGYDLDAWQLFDPCLELNPLDDKAVQALSGWLATKEKGRLRGDANAIGSATMPSFIRSVVGCRALCGVDSGYHEWRAAWFELDRHAGEDGREAHVMAVLDATRLPDKRAS